MFTICCLYDILKNLINNRISLILFKFYTIIVYFDIYIISLEKEYQSVLFDFLIIQINNLKDVISVCIKISIIIILGKIYRLISLTILILIRFENIINNLSKSNNVIIKI